MLPKTAFSVRSAVKTNIISQKYPTSFPFNTQNLTNKSITVGLSGILTSIYKDDLEQYPVIGARLGLTKTPPHGLETLSCGASLLLFHMFTAAMLAVCFAAGGLSRPL